MVFANLDFEERLWQQGFKAICGVDEVGRGCFAGPVVAGAVVFSKNCKIPEGIADSKLLTPRQRKKLAEEVKGFALSWAVGEVSVRDINKYGIGKATQMAFRKAIQGLSMRPDFVLVDAFYIKRLKGLRKARQEAIKKGDQISVSIAAASIIAKVHRDGLMRKLARKYPQYHFSRHKGYGTKLHQEAIRRYGLSKVHRKSFNLGKFILPGT